ncbi:MAG: hypothetical protein WCH34_10970 [Bacteroidota bacterium]
MNKILREKATTLYGLKLLVTNPDNVVIIETNDTTKNDVIHFLGEIELMDVEIEKALFNYKGITKNQNTARRNLGKYMFDKICSPSMRYARGKKNDDLMTIFNATASKIRHYPLSEVVQFCNTIFDKSIFLLANDSTYTTITSINTTTINNGKAVLNILKGYLGQPKNARIAKSIAKKNVKKIQDRIFEFDIENFLNDASFFVDTYPDFAKALEEATGIIDLPTQHTGIFGTMKDLNGIPIIHGEMRNLDMPNREVVYSDNLGNFEDEKFRWGLFRFEFSHPEFEDMIVVQKILRGVKSEVNVMMRRKS